MLITYKNLSPFTQRYIVPSLVENSQWFWRRQFLNFVNVFSLFHYNLPLEEQVALHLKKKLNPLHPRMLYTKFG